MASPDFKGETLGINFIKTEPADEEGYSNHGDCISVERLADNVVKLEPQASNSDQVSSQALFGNLFHNEVINKNISNSRTGRLNREAVVPDQLNSFVVPPLKGCPTITGIYASSMIREKAAFQGMCGNRTTEHRANSVTNCEVPVLAESLQTDSGSSVVSVGIKTQQLSCLGDKDTVVECNSIINDHLDGLIQDGGQATMVTGFSQSAGKSMMKTPPVKVEVATAKLWDVDNKADMNINISDAENFFEKQFSENIHTVNGVEAKNSSCQTEFPSSDDESGDDSGTYTEISEDRVKMPDKYGRVSDASTGELKISEKVNAEFEKYRSLDMLENSKGGDLSMGGSFPLPGYGDFQAKSYKCFVCGTEYSCNEDLKCHLQSHDASVVASLSQSGQPQGENKPHQCEICSRRYTRLSGLRSHLRTHTGEKPFTCTECNRGFAYMNSLKFHMLSHVESKPYSCEECGKSFQSSSHLKRHLMTHTGEKPFTCIVCQQKFSQAVTLRNHMTRHTGEKPFSCGICPKTFSKVANLNSHMVTHTGEKSYKCTECDKSFSHSCSLRMHKFTHTGEKPYVCRICDKSFYQSSNLKSHLLAHTGEKPFCCGMCPKRFTSSESLKRHKVTHSEEKPFSCEICKKTFHFSKGLKRHLLTHR